MYYKNSEGYPDPTAGEAIANVMREEKRIARSIRRKAERKRKKRTMIRVNTDSGKEKTHENEDH